MRIFLNHFRDCRQIIFVTLNRFFSVKYIPLRQSLLLTENIKLDRIPSKIKCKVRSYWFHFVSSFEVTSYKKIQLPVFYFYLFLYQQLPFFYIFHHFIQHYLKKDFRHKLLLFLTDSPQAFNLHNSQNLLSMTNVFFYLLYGYPRPTFSNCGGDSLTNPMLITTFFLFCLEDH